jgi:hypothetical protein
MSLDITLSPPSRCPHCGHPLRGGDTHSQNITHNLVAMAEEAGLYKVLWRPEEIGITHATQLIDPLRKGIAAMKADRPRFEKHNSSNGWGVYEQFVPWLEELLEACVANPDHEVSISR